MSTETLYLRVPPALKDAVERYAAARMLTLNVAARELLEAGLTLKTGGIAPPAKKGR